MSKKFLTLIVVCVVAACCFYAYNRWSVQQSSYSSQSENDNGSEMRAAAAKPAGEKMPEYRGPLDDCIQNSFIYTRYGQMEAECTLNYVHFFPSAQFKSTNLQKRNVKELKMGSFNMFHLGDNQAPLKNLALMAAVVNRWDLVGAQEFMPLPGDVANNNSALAQKIQESSEGELQFPYKNWRVISPGYLRLLEELQKLDSSWAVILQSNPAGEGSTGEMAGFFYRSSVVQLKEWDYCPAEKNIDFKNNQPAKNVGCLVQVAESQKNLISRTAFAAYFKAGKFDFVGLTTHIRFRAADLEADRKAQMDEICLNYTESKKPCSLPQDAIGRFYEVLAVADQISNLKEKAKDNDVIFMGDFNLELLPKTAPYWKAALKKAPGLAVFQSEPTTISAQAKKLASNYDHFIFDPNVTKACDGKTAKSYKVPLAPVAKNDTVMTQISEYMKLPKQQEWVDTLTKSLANLLKFQDKGEQVRPLSAKENQEFVDDYAKALKRVSVNDYAAALELLSDHIPVEMDCRTDLPDAD